VRRPLTFVALSHAEREDRTDWCPSRSVPAPEGTSGKDRCFERRALLPCLEPALWRVYPGGAKTPGASARRQKAASGAPG
jgi:hypothetical protein